MQTMDSSLRVKDTSRFCTVECQAYPALAAASPLVALQGLQHKCGSLNNLKVMIDAVEAFDAAWKDCAGAPVVERTQVDREVQVKANIYPGYPESDDDEEWHRFGKEKSRPRAPKPDADDLEIYLGRQRVDMESFEEGWLSIPMTYSRKFELSGFAASVRDELLQAPDTPISCQAEDVGTPVWLAVTNPVHEIRDLYRQFWGDGFAGIGGLGELARSEPDLFGGDHDVLGTARELSTSPSAQSLQAAITYFAHLGARADRSMMTRVFKWIQRKKTSMKLVLQETPYWAGSEDSDDEDEFVTKFLCVRKEVKGSGSKSLVVWVDGAQHTLVTAEHLALLLATLI